MTTHKSFLIIAAFIALVTSSCKVDPKLPVSLDPKEMIPPGFPAPLYTFSTNVVSKERFEIGRELFYDPILSIDNTVACGSCHEMRVAFANQAHDLSHGVNSQKGKRNAPALFNLAWHPYFMQDGGINNIELQPVGPICNPVEMADNMSDVINKLQASAKYRSLFKKAYGTDTVTSVQMLYCLTQFMGLMYSYNSKYDYFKRNENHITFNDQELNGYRLFIKNCSSCHQEPLFSDFKLRSNGLSVDPYLRDSGRAHITGLPEDLYKFKTPSLRNIAVTGPYMHDGRFQFLEDCIDHYRSTTSDSGIVNRINLDPLLKDGIPLSDQEKSDIIQFLNTLTDYEFSNDKRFGDPRFN